VHDEPGLESGPDSWGWRLLAPSPESQDFAHSARAHFEKIFPIRDVREWISGAAVPDVLWQTVIDAGYTEVGLPPELGGAGTILDLVILLHEAGRVLCPVPLLATCSAAQAQLTGGIRPDGPARHRNAFGAGTGSVTQQRVTSERIEVLDGATAEQLTLLLFSQDHARLVVVDRSAPGLALARHRRDHDASRPVTSLGLDSVPAAAHAVLSLQQAEEVLAAVRTCLAADLTGLAEGAAQKAIEHVRQRRQFGQYLGEFQAVKHLLADAHVEIEKARSLTLGAAIGLLGKTGRDRIPQLSLFASATAAESALRASSLYVQLLGAMGVTYEADAHLHLKRAHQTVLALDPPATAFRRAAELERDGCA
jgi:alkylation response protein AidB-like acyl-CoA dehydrogenase